MAAGALLGLIPGCIGGFAAVSLYSHGIISMGSLVAAMISSSGDESFVMLAMIPRQALILFAVLFVLAIVCGLLTDLMFRKHPLRVHCDPGFELHEANKGEFPNIFRLSSYKVMRGSGKERIVLMVAILIFVAAVFSVVLLVAASSEHFVKEHLWHHVIRKHALKTFLWTAGALAVITVVMHYVNIGDWLKDNTYYLLILAALIGMIPESGPHMVFISLFAGGIVPFSVLLTSSMSQDGHTSLPLLASSTRSFLIAKILNALFAVAVGSVFYFLGF